MNKRIFGAALLAALPLAAAAQSSGELWELTMNIPGMPAGMMPPQRVCQGDDPSRAARQDPSKKDCKVTSSKKTASGSYVTMSCPDGSTMTIDQQYNAARTEFKTTMSSKGGRDGDMTMNMTGRKVGACDVQQAAKERDEKSAAMKKQVDAAMAQGAAATKQYADGQIKQCATALESMQSQQFHRYGQCYKKTDAQCKSDMDTANRMSPEIWKSCTARIADFCKRYQTQDGFLKAKADESAAQMCGVTTASVKAAECPKAAQSGSLGFLGPYCPVEAKPIAQEHCTQRDYTSRMGGKYARFCDSYFAANSLQKPGAQPPSATDQVKQGVSKGIDKLKGLFGR
jgi:hypothetical protein